jgi:hypothetical protein
MDSSRSPAALLLLCVVGYCVVLAIRRSLMAAKGNRISSVFGSSKGGRAGGQNDRLEYRRSNSTNND